MKKNPYLIKCHKIEYNPKYTAIDKNIHGVKIVNTKHQSVLKPEDEWYEKTKPNVYTYSPDDRKVRAKLPIFTFS